MTDKNTLSRNQSQSKNALQRLKNLKNSGSPSGENHALKSEGIANPRAEGENIVSSSSDTLSSIKKELKRDLRKGIDKDVWVSQLKDINRIFNKYKEKKDG